MVIAVGTVVLTADRRPLCVRPGPVQVPLDQLGPARHPDLADDPRDRDRQCYTLYENIGLLNSIPGLIIANAGARGPVRDLDHAGVHARSAYLDRRGGPGRRGRPGPRVLVHRGADQPELLITVGLFAFLFAWSDFIYALTLTTEGNITPVTLGIYTYLGAHISNWSAVMATAMLASIPAIILLVIAQKYIAAGASAEITGRPTPTPPTPKESPCPQTRPPRSAFSSGGRTGTSRSSLTWPPSIPTACTTPSPRGSLRTSVTRPG